MFDQIKDIEDRFIQIENDLSNLKLDRDKLTELAKERAKIEYLVQTYREYNIKKKYLEDIKSLQNESDAELKELIKEEHDKLSSDLICLEKKLKELTLPKDPNDDKNVILEVRAGTGGEEAALFCSDLMRMYLRYADRNNWKIEILNTNLSSTGGVKEVIMSVSGEKVFSRLKFEKGTHRVQRIPTTESQGRIHTSACTVAVLPEADDIDIDINPSDLDIKVCRASGAGGQHVNTTDSAVRILHKPTDIVVECQDERSQHKNKSKALKILKARVLDKLTEKQKLSISKDRKDQVGSGDRSGRIRTYNFPQGRVTDHRINLTLYNIEAVMAGDIDEIINSLAADHQKKVLNK